MESRGWPARMPARDDTVSAQSAAEEHACRTLEAGGLVQALRADVVGADLEVQRAEAGGAQIVDHGPEELPAAAAAPRVRHEVQIGEVGIGTAELEVVTV